MPKNMENQKTVIKDLADLGEVKNNFPLENKTDDTKTKNFGGARNKSKKIYYVAEKVAQGGNLSEKEDEFFEKNREEIYAKVNEIKNYEDDPNILSVEVSKQVDSIEADQVKASGIVSQIDNPKDKEEGNEELEQIQKDTNQVINEVQTEEERIIAELQEVKKNLDNKTLNSLSGVEKIKIKKYSSDKKIQVSEGDNKNFEDQAKNAMDAYKVAIAGLKQIKDSLPEEKNKENTQKNTTLLKENKDILDLWNKGAEFIEKRKQELEEEGKTKREIDEIIAKEWKTSKESSEIDKIYSTIPKPKKIIKNNKDSNNIKKFPDLSNKIEEREKSDFEKIYETLNISEQKEVDALLDKGIEDFREQRKKLIEGGKTPDEASVITYQEWLKTKDGQKYQEILSNAEKRMNNSETPNSIDELELELKTQASILNDLTNQEIEIKDKYFSIKEKLEKNEGLTEEEKKELETELTKYEKLRQEINDKVGKQTEKVNDLLEKQKEEQKAKENIIPTIEQNDKVLNELQKQQLEKVNAFLNEKKEQKTGFFKKTLDWWNNLDQSRIGKISKTVMSAGFIGTALYFAGDKLDMLPKNQNLAQKLGSRTFLAGLSSALITSNFTKNTLSSIKEKWNKLGTTGKILAGTALGVGGAGAFVYFAGATTLGITIGAVGAKLGLNKVLFDKKIDTLKTEKEKAEKRIEELNAKIKSFENDPTFDVEAFMQELPTIQSELDKYNNKLRNWKIGKSLTSGIISLASGLGSMAASHLEVNDKAREFIDNGIKRTGGIFKNLSEKIKNIDLKYDLDKDLDKDMNTPTGGAKGAGGGGNEIIDKNQNKFDIKNIKPEAIIDGQSRIGITYAFRDQLCADEELAKKLGIEDLSKLNDPAYVAKITKEIAIKTGYMDSEGHEIRINKEGIGKIAYVLGVDAEGKIEVKEVDTQTGEILETHCEGDTFEGSGKDKYEYEKIKKAYSNIEKAYDKNNIVKPEEVVSSNGDPFSNSYLNGDDSSSYLEDTYNNGITKPEEVIDNSIADPEKVTQIYKFEDIQNSPDWANLKENNLKDFFATGKINMSEEEIKIAESLREFYKQALKATANDTDDSFKNFVQNEKSLNLSKAILLYQDVIKQGGFTEELKEKYNFVAYQEALINSEMKGGGMKEIIKIAKENFENKFTDKELVSVKRNYTDNIYRIFGTNLGDATEWETVKNLNAKDYIKLEDNNPLTQYMNRLKEVTGLKPKNGFLGMGHQEQIDEYIMRATMKAKLDGRLDEIIPYKSEPKINTEDYDDYKPSKKIDIKTENGEAGYGKYNSGEYKPYGITKNTGSDFGTSNEKSDEAGYGKYNSNNQIKNNIEKPKIEVKKDQEDYSKYGPYDPSKNKGGDDLYRKN